MTIRFIPPCCLRGRIRSDAVGLSPWAAWSLRALRARAEGERERVNGREDLGGKLLMKINSVVCAVVCAGTGDIEFA